MFYEDDNCEILILIYKSHSKSAGAQEIFGMQLDCHQMITALAFGFLRTAFLDILELMTAYNSETINA